jgi:outer membrane protein TolC
MTTRKRLDELQKLSQTQLNSVIQGILADVMLKYYAVVQQQNFSTTLEKSLEVSKQRLSIIESRRSVGMSNDADLIQAKLDVNSQLQSIQSQKLVIEQAKTDLLRAMTQQTESNIAIQDTILVDAKLDWDALKTSINSHPDIMAADQQITINQFLEKETKARLSPTLNLNAGVSYIRSQSAAGLTLLNQTYGFSWTEFDCSNLHGFCKLSTGANCGYQYSNCENPKGNTYSKLSGKRHKSVAILHECLEIVGN